jgi:hypothetical protein
VWYLGSYYSYTVSNILINLFLCRKRKPRANTTKAWFPKEPGNSSHPPSTTAEAEDIGHVYSPSQAIVLLCSPAEDIAASSVPRVIRRVVRKMTPKKKIKEWGCC